MSEKMSGNGKTNWKLILAVVLIIAIGGFLFFTGIGSQFVSQLGIGSLTAFFVKQAPTSTFSFTLNAQKEAFYGQQYKLTNSSLEISGIYQYIHVGTIYLESKEGKTITVVVKNLSGTFEYGTAGSIIVKGTTTYAEIGGIAASPEKTINIEMEIIPSDFVLASLSQNPISFGGISGSLQRMNGNNLDTVNLVNNKLTINYFSGSLSMKTDGSTVLEGSASSIKGDNFSFS
jgi:hypothetical protein